MDNRTVKTEAILQIAKAVSKLVCNVEDTDNRKIEDLKAVQLLLGLSEDCGFSPDAFMVTQNA